MFRLASLLNQLTCLVILVGIVSAFLMYRPGGASEALDALIDLASTSLSSFWVPALAAVAITSTLLRRYLSRPLPLEPSRKTHRLEEADFASPDPLGSEPGVRHMADRLKRRLEVLLRGKTDTVALVDEMLAGAILCHATDVHLQPREGFALLSLRLEGELVDLTTVAETQYIAVVRRLKVLAHLTPYKTEEPQDGRFSLATLDESVDVRMAVLPTRHGEKVALRLLRPGDGLLKLDELGMDDATLAAFRRLLEQPQGLVVLTGPTGSGKTTTLYSALDHLYRTRGDTVHLATLEDPVEIDLPFLSQTQVDRGRGLDFATGLRALLRQDPGVLMVGEIRDQETARIAVQAGLTGHLILTSLHAESTTGVFTRLIDMEIEPFLVASATLACVSQRLVRRLCESCRQPIKIDRAMASRLASRGMVPEPGTTFFAAEGCHSCEQSGVRGRLAVYEMLSITPELRRQIAAKTPTQEIEETALAGGMKPLRQQAMTLAATGRISLDEALRVAS